MTTTENEVQDYRRELTRDELLLTQDKVQKINDRAARRGWTGRLEIEAERVEITEENEAGIEVTRVVYLTKITGEAPCYDGWTFLAVLDWHSAGGELITRMAPGVDFEGTIDRSALREGECDHCGMIRNRKDVYLVRHADGTTKQVGSTCIKDFLGWSTTPAWISTDEAEEKVFEGMGGAGRWVDFDVKSVLAAAWALIKRDGFTPASFGAGSTKDGVLTVLDPRCEKDRQFAAKVRPLMAEAQAQADAIRAYVLDELTGDSEYVVNLKVACRANYVSARAFGLVVSAPQAWAKAVERDLTRKAEREQVCNEYLGKVGDKLELRVVVKAIRPVDSGYGTSYLYTMSTEDGHVVKWFSSSKALGDETTGELVTIKGTVKKLEEYKEVKQTMLTRCKVL